MYTSLKIKSGDRTPLAKKAGAIASLFG